MNVVRKKFSQTHTYITYICTNTQLISQLKIKWFPIFNDSVAWFHWNETNQLTWNINTGWYETGAFYFRRVTNINQHGFRSIWKIFNFINGYHTHLSRCFYFCCCFWCVRCMMCTQNLLLVNWVIAHHWFAICFLLLRQADRMGAACYVCTN